MAAIERKQCQFACDTQLRVQLGWPPPQQNSEVRVLLLHSVISSALHHFTFTESVNESQSPHEIKGPIMHSLAFSAIKTPSITRTCSTKDSLAAVKTLTLRSNAHLHKDDDGDGLSVMQLLLEGRSSLSDLWRQIQMWFYTCIGFTGNHKNKPSVNVAENLWKNNKNKKTGQRQ